MRKILMSKKLLCALIISGISCSSMQASNITGYYHRTFATLTTMQNSAMFVSFEDENILKIQMDVSGYTKGGLTTRVCDDGRRLHVEAVQHDDGTCTCGHDATLIYKYSGDLPCRVTKEGAHSELKDGILTLILQKAEQVDPFDIEISE